MAQYIPILMYHKVGNESPGWVPTNIFQKHMNDVKELKYTPIFIRHLMDYNLGIRKLPERPIIITFDDAYENFYTEAAPIMIDLGIKSMCFVPTAHVGKTNEWDTADSNPIISHMNWSQIQILHMTNMIDFQAHSDTHPDLAKMPLKDVLVELIYSKLELQDKLQKRIEFLAWPFGGRNRQCIRAAQESGYEAACASGFSVEKSIQNLNDIQPYVLRRISVTNLADAIQTINIQIENFE